MQFYFIKSSIYLIFIWMFHFNVYKSGPVQFTSVIVIHQKNNGFTVWILMCKKLNKLIFFSVAWEICVEIR